MVANREALREAGHDRHHFRRIHAHDFGGLRSRQRVLETLGLIGLDRRLEVDDESAIGWHRIGLRIVGRKQLVVGVEEAFARICARHQIGVQRVAVDLENADLAAGVVGIRLAAGQSLVGLVGGRTVAVGRIKKTEHLIE